MFVTIATTQQKETNKQNVRFKVLTAVKMSILVFWVVMSCGLSNRYQRFEGTCCFDLQTLQPIKPMSTQTKEFSLKSLEIGISYFFVSVLRTHNSP
jgi:hypothetical protein